MFKKSFALAILLALLSAGFATAASAKTPVSSDFDDHSKDPAYAKFYQQSIVWSQDLPGCPKLEQPFGPVECAKILAPRDWQDLSKGELHVAISRKVGSDLSGRRLLLTNPGGPGGSGLEFGMYFTRGVFQNHVSIGIDPRGVGASDNLVCPETPTNPNSFGANGDSRTFTREQVRNAEQDFASYVKTCAAQPGTLLPYINSYQTAFDFNLVRALMGVATSDYYGISYGTWLGSVIERSFPTKFDRVITDSNLDWSFPMEEGFEWQLQAMQAGFDRGMLPFVARHNDIYHLGSSTLAVNKTYERIRAALKQKPGIVTPDTLDTVLVSKLYAVSQFDDAARFLLALGTLVGDPAVAGQMSSVDAQTLVDQYKSDSASGGSPVFAAVTCGDTAATRGHWDKNLGLAKTMPFASWGVIDQCTGWPYKPALDKKFFDRPVNILMAQNENDGPTSYNGAVNALRRSPGNVTMVFYSNQFGHGVPWTPEYRAILANYFATGKLPASDVRLFGQPMQTQLAHDDKVYEVFNPSSSARPLPFRYPYIVRDLSELTIDQEATNALPKPDGKTVAEYDPAFDNIHRIAHQAHRSLIGQR